MGNSDAAAVRPRSDFIDRVRVVLNALFIVHLTAITYGGHGGWFYREGTDDGLPGSMALRCAVAQAFQHHERERESLEQQRLRRLHQDRVPPRHSSRMRP